MIIHIPVRHRQQGGKITLKVNIAEPGRSLLDRPLLLSQMFLHSALDHKFSVAKRMYKLRTSAGPLLSARDAGQRLRERSHSSQR